MRMHPRLSLLVISLLVGCGSTAPVVRAPEAPVEVTPADAERAVSDLAAHVDDRLGLVVVEDIADAEGETDPTRRASLRCGATLATMATELATYIATRPPEGEAPGWSCEGHDCELPGMMEYDPNRILRFGRGEDGSVVVRGYFAIDALAVDPERLASTRTNADRDFDELSRSRCD
jgi:hypothetical protein